MPVTIPVFDFPNHIVQDLYPESSAKVNFGGGYQFASYPLGPDQVKFTLSFAAMRFYVNTDGTMDATTDAKNNMWALQQFYESVRLWRTFIYTHPARGPLFVRFDSALQVPKGVPGGSGVVEPFDVKLVLQP